MADYEDQNSSEYKDMNQETQAADQNPQNGQPIPPSEIEEAISTYVQILDGLKI